MVHDVTKATDLQFLKSHASERPDPARATAEAASAASAQDASVDRTDLERAAAKIREVVQKVEPRLQIEIDPDLDRVVMKLLNGESGEIIRQIPPQELLDLAKQLADPQGLLLKEQA